MCLQGDFFYLSNLKEKIRSIQMIYKLTENLVPVSVQEDINELSDKLANGDITLGELENKDQFVVEVIQKAKNRI
jgi:hypothetical protein